MSQGKQEFTFTTQPAPQTEGVGGAYWENIPLASFPPSLDLSIPDSFGNAVSTALSNLTSSFEGLSNTLTSVTQSLQNAACSFGGLVDSLKAAQAMAKNFAEANNKTKIYVRPIGLQPAGNITSQSAFIGAVRSALNDTGVAPGQIPKIVPAEVPLDPVAIANALGSGGNFAEQLLEGKTFGGAIKLSIGEGLGTLSNDDQIKNGFAEDQFAAPIIGIIRESPTSPEIKIALQDTPPVNPNDLVGKSVQVAGTIGNNGSFKITGFSDGSVTQQPGATTNLLSGGIIGATQSLVSKAQAAISPFFIKINNNAGSNKPAAGEVLIQLGGLVIPARDKIRSSLTKRGLMEHNKRKTIPVTELVKILIEDKIIGVNLGQFEKDKNIAIERISRLTSPTNFKVGGIVLVGQAADIQALAAKVTALSGVIEFLQPLAQQLALQSAAASSQAALNPTGISFDPTNVQLTKLNSNQNVGKKDAQSAKKKAQDSGVMAYTPTPLVSLAAATENPAPNNFNAWRFYSPTDLVPSLKLFGPSLKNDTVNSGLKAIDDANSFLAAKQASLQKTTGNALANVYGTLGDTIQDGMDAVGTGLNALDSKSKSIDGIVAQMNDVNQQIVDGINFLKNQLGKNPFKIDGHLIGSKLGLLSNAQYADEVELAVKDVTDPNRPTFGPPASKSVLDNQSNTQALAQGIASPARANRLWFGLVIFIVGNGREDLGTQMRAMANIFNMDDSAIDLPAKTKIDPFKLSSFKK